MRTNTLSRAARIGAVTGFAVALSSASLITAAAAAPSPTPVPSTTASATPVPTATPTVRPTPTSPPTPGPNDWDDSSIRATAADRFEPGAIAVVKHRIRNTVRTDSYRLRIRAGDHVGVFEVPKHDGWDCDVSESQVDCTYTGPATRVPGDVWVAFKLPAKPGKYGADARVSTDNNDADSSNNNVITWMNVEAKRTGTGIVAGGVWHDADRNGIRDTGEKGVAGAKLTLRSGTVVVGRATTGADGRYSFTKLPPTTAQMPAYNLTVNAPNKTWQFTEFHAGPSGDRDSDVQPDPKNAQQGYAGHFSVTNGKTTRLDAGLTNDNKATGTIAGRVWHDANRNGRQDKGEQAVAGARLVVAVADGNTSKVISRATTGADGRYSFTKLPVGYGKYGVVIATPDKNWTFTESSKGAEAGDSDFRAENVNGTPAGPLFEGWFGKDAIVGLHDRTDVEARTTTVLDAGLISRGGGSGTDDELPKTGAAAGGILGAGALLLGGGVALTALARRRRPAVA